MLLRHLGADVPGECIGNGMTQSLNKNDRKREIHLIDAIKNVDRDGNVSYYCQVIQINKIATDSAEYIDEYNEFVSDVNIIKTIYIYTAVISDMTAEAFVDADLHLHYVLSSGYGEWEYENNKHYQDYGTTILDITKTHTNISICNLYHINRVLNMEGKILLGVPHPLYYDKLFDKRNSYSVPVYKGLDLIDDYTDDIIIEKDCEKNNITFEKSCTGDENDFTNEIIPNPINYSPEITNALFVIEDLNSKVLEVTLVSLFDSYRFIYDSDHGFNIDKIKPIPANRWNKSKVDMDINHLVKTLKPFGKQFEEIFGQIRMIYYVDNYHVYIRVIYTGKDGFRYRVTSKNNIADTLGSISYGIKEVPESIAKKFDL